MNTNHASEAVEIADIQLLATEPRLLGDHEIALVGGGENVAGFF